MALQKTPMTPSPAKVSAAAPQASKQPKTPFASMSPGPFWIGLGVSVAWVATVLVVVASSGSSNSLAGVSLVNWAIGISAAVSPVAMVWMITAYMQRAADIQTIADPLRRQLSLITGESGAADARIRRFNQALREQIDLLRGAQTVSQEDLEGLMDRVRQHRADLERFENVSSQQVKEIQDVVRRSMFQLEQMMDDKFTMLRVLDGKLQQNGDGVARQVESVSDHVSRLLGEVEGTSAQIVEALENAQRNSQKLSDTSRLQESSLTNAAEVAAETLGGLSSKIDLSVARFLERASTAREEAERLANALDAQTRALDDFSTTLPARVSEAESVLRGVADRLYASEQMAREQAVHLSEKLTQQVDGLQKFMDRFSGRMGDIDASLDKRHTDLNNLAERIGSTTTGFVDSWEQSISGLNERTTQSLSRFSSMNDESRRSAESVASHLNETTTRYEDVVTRMRALSSDSSVQMKGMTEEVARHLSQFEALSKASAQAGEEVQGRASAALQNLQHVLERVLAARDATQTVGETLVRDINAAVDQNEKMIARLTETAQLGARTIGSAAEQMNRNEIDLSDRLQTSQQILVDAVRNLQDQADISSASLREQAARLQDLLADTQSQIATTDSKMQSFATQAVAPVHQAVDQIRASADEGLTRLTVYGDGLSEQIFRLQDFHGRIGSMSTEMGKTTAETANALESLSSRFAASRIAQEESARQTLAQFVDLADRLQREVAGLDGQAARSVEILRDAAVKIGEESYQMLQNAQGSGSKIKEVTASLQVEAAQIQSILSQQAQQVNTDLTQAEQKFSALGETMRERADAAMALLERTATQYGDVSHKLDVVSNDAARVEQQAGEIAASTGRAAQNLSNLSDKMEGTHNAAVAYADQTLAKIADVTGSFESRAADLRQSAQIATDQVIQAGVNFGEQSGRLIDGSRQIDAVLRQLTQATGSLADQAAQIRAGMEQQNNRLLAQLADSVAQMDVTGLKLQQTVTVAVQGADQAGTRFADMTETASKRITSTTQELQGAAERTESALGALNANIAQQAASLSAVGEQICSQQKTLAAANEKQREQMIDLFDKLGAAHKQATDVAERSVAFLNQSMEEIHRQMGLVGDQSQTAVGNVKLACVGFTDQATQLIQNAQAAEQQTRTILSVTSALQEQARHLRESLTLESERAGESLGLLLNRLTASGTEVSAIGAGTSTLFTALQRALAEQGNELSLSMQQINDRQRSLTASLDQQRDAINGLLNRLILAQDETGSSAERAALRLTDGAQQISRHIEVIDTRAQSALVNVQAAASGFAEQVGAIEAQSRQAEIQARAVLASASGMHEQIHDLRKSMQGEGEKTNAIFSGLLDKITAGAAELRDLGATTEMSLMSLGNNAQQQIASLTSAMQQISDRQRSLAAALDAQRDVVNGLLNRLTLAQDETAAIADRTVTRLHDGAQQIIRNADTLEQRTQGALVTVQSAAEAYAKEAAAIDAQAKQTEMQAQAILASASDLHGQIYDLRTSMENDGARATDALDKLLVRAAGGETTLSELAATMQDIGERQATLNAALDRQRETINGLLNRFTLAQDETSSAAERSAERISESAQRISNSLDLIGAQASTALASVQESTLGFADQARALAAHSKEAEQQMQGALSVSTGMQEQARHLREAMQAETSRAVEQLAAVIAQLDLTSRHLKSESADAVETLENSARRFAATGDHSADLIKRQAELFEQAADQSDARMSNAGDKMRGHLRLVGEIGDKAEQQARQLADVAEFATTRLASMREVFDFRKIEEALQGQMRQLMDQSESLRANLAASEAALNEAAQNMRIEATDLPAVLQRSAAGVEIAAQKMKEQVGDADQSLVGTADRFIAVTAAARNNMVEEMTRVSSVADDAGQLLTRFNQILSEQVAAMQRNTATMSAEQKTLVEKATFSVTVLAEAGSRLTTLRSEAAATAERLAHEFSLLDQRASATGSHLSQAGEGIARQIEAIAEASVRAEQKISGAGDTLNGQLERIRAGLQSQVDDINRSLMQITAQLERTGSTLRSTSVGAVADVERVGQRFDATGGEAAAKMQEAANDVAKMLAGFGTQFDAMIAHIARAGEGIKRQEGDTVSHLQTMLGHLSTVAERLEAARALSGDVSQHAIDRLDEVVNAVQAQMHNMAAGAQTAAGIMRGIGQIYSDQTQALNKGVGEAHNQVLTMNESIESMQQRTEQMRSTLKFQSEDLMRSLGTILNQIQATGDNDITDGAQKKSG